jgi:polar amino acid transport system substrate-binding protein
MKNPAFAVALSAVLSTSFIATAQADKLDDIIGSGKLRCAVTLDFPPMGFRDAGNNPAGFDVDYCHDLAKILGSRPKWSRHRSRTVSRRWSRGAPM